MKWLYRVTGSCLALSALFLVSWAIEPAGAEDASTADAYVVVCPVNGLIDDGVLILVERAVKYAAGAEALILVVDTPGGRVDSCLQISDALLKAPCRTIAFVTGMGAISAGAVISLSCDEIMVSEAAAIGATAPVILTPEGALPTGEKEVSFLRAKIAAIAEAKKHNVHLAQAMVDKDIELVAYPRGDGTFEVVASRTTDAGMRRRNGSLEALGKAVEDAAEDLTRKLPAPLAEPAKDLVRDAVREATNNLPPPAAPPAVRPDGGIVILESGKLLTLRPSEAKQYGLIRTIVKDLDDAIAAAGHAAARRLEIVPTWSESLFRWLISPPVASLLLLIGLGGLYFEVKTPGFGLPGVLAIVCLSLFFGARLVVGLSEWIDILLVVAGVVLLLIEIFVLPGFGLVGVAGFLCVVVGFYMSFTFDDFTLPKYTWDVERLREAGLTVIFVMVGLPVVIGALWKLLPQTPLYGHVVLRHAQDPAQGYTVQTSDASAAVGWTGTAVSPLRPAGRARFGDKTLQVVSRAEFVEPGASVVVVQVDGNRYVVDPVRPLVAPPPGPGAKA